MLWFVSLFKGDINHSEPKIFIRIETEKKNPQHDDVKVIANANLLLTN